MYTKPATDLSYEKFSEAFNAAYDGYIAGTFTTTPEYMIHFVKVNYVSLSRSLVMYDSETNEIIGFCIIAVRPDRPKLSRVATFGIVPTHKGKGVGSKLIREAIASERAHGTETLELECIQENTAALKLYQKAGFKILRELAGYEGKASDEALAEGTLAEPELQDGDIEHIRGLVRKYASEDLPWQAWIAEADETSKAFTLGHAHCIYKVPEGKDDIRLVTLFVEPEYRGKGEATRLAKAVAKKLNKYIVAAALYPKEYGQGIAKSLGLKDLFISQYQMRVDLRE